MLNTSEGSAAEMHHAWATTARTRTYFISAGHGDPLLLLHGAGGDCKLFTGIIPALAEKRAVIAPDLPGHGRSEGLSGLYTVPAYLRWLNSFIDAMGLGPVDLVGHSLGGALALRYAGKYPAKVKRLVLVDAISLGFPSLAATLRLLIAMFTRDEQLSRARMGRVMFAGDDARRQEMAAAFLGGDASPPTGLGGFLWMLSRTWHIALPVSSRALENLRLPVLILWGDDDSYFPRSHAQRAQREIPASKLAFIPGAGHAPFLEQPAIFIEGLEL